MMDAGAVWHEVEGRPADLSVLAWRMASESPSSTRAGTKLSLTELAAEVPSSLALIHADGLVHRMPRDAAAELMRTCFRTLMPLGLIRATTIDMDRLVHGYLFDWTEDGKNGGPSRTARLNAAFRRADAVFLYGEEELTSLLVEAGFEQIRRFAAGASSEQRFWNLESDRAHSLVLEASKA